MLLQTFSENEVVQILDPATAIWESAKIISFVNDWCVTIKWVDWPYKKKENITVPEEDRPDRNHWNIRKSQHIEAPEETLTQKRRSTPLTFCVRKLVRNDQVYFWQPACDCVDRKRCHEDRCCGSVVMGRVETNDPFKNQCLVTDAEGSVYVPYRQLRNKPSSTESNLENDEDEDEDSRPEAASPPVRKQARVSFTRQPLPQVDILSLLPHVEDDVELTYAPCFNDIIKVSYHLFN